MYIGPWQEYKLGKLIADHTALLQRALQQQQQKDNDVLNAEFARLEYSKLTLPAVTPVSGLLNRGLAASRASLGSTKSNGSTRSAPEHFGQVPKLVGSLGSNRPNSASRRPGNLVGKRKPMRRGPQTKKEIIDMHKGRIDIMRSLYGLNDGGIPAPAEDTQSLTPHTGLTRRGDYHITPSPANADDRPHSRLRLAIDDPAGGKISTTRHFNNHLTPINRHTNPGSPQNKIQKQASPSYPFSPLNAGFSEGPESLGPLTNRTPRVGAAKQSIYTPRVGGAFTPGSTRNRSSHGLAGSQRLHSRGSKMGDDWEEEVDDLVKWSRDIEIEGAVPDW